MLCLIIGLDKFDYRVNLTQFNSKSAHGYYFLIFKISFADSKEMLEQYHYTIFSFTYIQKKFCYLIRKKEYLYIIDYLQTRTSFPIQRGTVGGIVAVLVTLVRHGEGWGLVQGKSVRFLKHFSPCSRLSLPKRCRLVSSLRLKWNVKICLAAIISVTPPQRINKRRTYVDALLTSSGNISHQYTKTRIRRQVDSHRHSENWC